MGLGGSRTSGWVWDGIWGGLAKPVTHSPSGSCGRVGRPLLCHLADGAHGKGFVSSSHLCQAGQEQLKGRDGGGRHRECPREGALASWSTRAHRLWGRAELWGSWQSSVVAGPPGPPGEVLMDAQARWARPAPSQPVCSHTHPATPLRVLVLERVRSPGRGWVGSTWGT